MHKWYNIIMWRHELSENQWNKIKDLFPQRGSLRADGMQRATAGCWTRFCIGWTRGSPGALSQRHGSWQTVYSRFRTWTQADVWEQVLHALIAQDLVDGTALMPDSTTEKYTGMAVGLKRGLWRRGRTEPGRTGNKDPYGNRQARQPFTFPALQQ